MLDLVVAGRAHPVELLLGALLEQGLDRPVEREARLRMAAGREDRAERLVDERRGERPASMRTRSPGFTPVE